MNTSIKFFVISFVVAFTIVGVFRTVNLTRVGNIDVAASDHPRAIPKEQPTALEPQNHSQHGGH
jgi:hypothetical protein